MKVVRDLYRELPKKNFQIGQLSPEQNYDNTLKILEEFRLLPKLYSGQEVKLECTLGKSEHVTQNECDAFDLSYGASIKRRIILIDKEIKAIMENSIDYMYGNYESAETLIGIDESSVQWIQMKGKFGYYKKEIEKQKVFDADEFREKDQPWSSLGRVFLSYGPKKKMVAEYTYETVYLKGFIFIDLL